MLFFLLFTGAAALLCGQYGRSIQIDGLRYYCNDAEVSSSKYNSTDPACSSETVVTEGCLCPADYYGPTCESQRAISCEIDVLGPAYVDCVGGRDWSNELLGYPECFYVKPDATIDFSISAKCHTENPGVYIDEEYLNYTDKTVSEIYSDQVEFQYVIDNGEVVSSHEIEASLFLVFINFNKLSDKRGIKTSRVDRSGLLSEVLINVRFDLSTIPGYEVAGRYYYDLYLQGSSEASIHSNTYRNVLDRQGYEEPDFPDKLSAAALAGILLGCTALVILIAVIIFVYYRRKKLRLD